MITENRRFRRITIPCKVTLSADGADRPVHCHTENIGAGGVMIISGQKLELDTQVELELSLWHSDNPLKCKGRVAWVNEIVPKEVSPRLFNTGIEFVDISDADRNAVGEFVNFISTMDR
jgi:c-di-GMP-binding flagellar brake protein YcgR